MKKIVLFLLMACFVSFGFAEIGWCGNIWPNSESTQAYSSDITVYFQIWKDGFTPGEGAGMGLAATLYYKKSTDGSFTSVSMSYNGEVGNNDEYMGTIPQSAYSGGETINFYCEAYDVLDSDIAYGTDQNNAGPFDSSSPGIYYITEAPLPISLSSFTAEALKGKVELNWVTESETENAHFLVYRDGDLIAQVEGNGTTSETHSYSYTDTRVRAGVHRYALADVTYGGVMEMHESVEVEVEAEVEAAAAEFVLNKAYPNPFNPRTAISYQLSAITDIDLSIYNTGGEKVATLYNGEQLAGQHMHTWDAAGMSSGIYVIRMMARDVMKSQKIVLMK